MRKQTSSNRISQLEDDPLHALCPYFAMFPPSFARKCIESYTKTGDLVVDPFSGRGTTMLEARLLGRQAIANDINPVAHAVTAAKCKKLNLYNCVNKINKLRAECLKEAKTLSISVRNLPAFFHYAFSEETLNQILWLRKRLVNPKSAEEVFIKALCLSHLHGETNKIKKTYFSNNLPHTYCPRQDYSISYWKNHLMAAPKVNAFDVLLDRCIFRLHASKQGEAKYVGKSILGDARRIGATINRVTNKKVQLVVTSPPYLRITSYEEDQWLRMWFMGGNPYPATGQVTTDDRINSIEKYTQFIATVWASLRTIMHRDGHVVCRIGKSFKDDVDLIALMKKSIEISGGYKIKKITFSDLKKGGQAIMFGKKTWKAIKQTELRRGEYDFVLRAS